jgi:uncharacterized protein (TIGR02118 family)
LLSFTNKTRRRIWRSNGIGGADMYKVMGILKRPDDMSIEEFQKWWLEEHANLVKKFPGLKRYAINLTTSEDQRFDGVAEVWFESKEALEKIFTMPEGEAARQSATSHSKEIVILFTQENVIIEG